MMVWKKKASAFVLLTQVSLLAACGASSQSARLADGSRPIHSASSAHLVAGQLASLHGDSNTAAGHFLSAQHEQDRATIELIAIARAQAIAQSDPAKALRELELTAMDRTIEYWLARGKLQIANQRPQSEVSESFAHARASAPRDRRGYMLEVEFVTDHQRKEELLRKLLSFLPRDYEANFALAFVLTDRQWTPALVEQAMALLDVALQVEPNLLDARLLRASLLLWRKQTDKAIADLRSAFLRSKEEVSIGKLLVRHLFVVGERQDAVDLLVVLAAERSKDELLELIELAIGFGQLDFAAAQISNLESTPQVHRIRAELAFASGDVALAAKLAAKHNIATLQAWIALHENRPEAVAELKLPDDEEGRLIAAESLAATGMLTKARALLKAGPADVRAMFEYRYGSHFEAARLASRNSGDGLRVAGLATLALRRSESESEQLIRQALAWSPVPQNLAALGYLLCVGEGNAAAVTESLTLLNRARTLAPYDDEVAAHLLLCQQHRMLKPADRTAIRYARPHVRSLLTSSAEQIRAPRPPQTP